MTWTPAAHRRGRRRNLPATCIGRALPTGIPRRLAGLLCITLTVATAGAQIACDRPMGESRVLVFGIDGGTWDVIEPLFAAGELPNLKRLHERGVHGVLQSRPPAISPVVWSTVFTGRPHSEHGVESWKTSQSSHRKVKAIWDITSDAGLSTHVLNVPSTWPPTTVTGTMLSGFPISGSTIGGNTGTVVSRSGLGALERPACYGLNRESIGRQAEGLEVGEWSPYFGLQTRSRRRAQMRLFRLAEDRYYLSPCYRIDSGLVISYPADARAALDRALGEPYIPEGPGWSRYAEAETPHYLYDHLAQVARNQTRAAALLASDDWRLFIFVNTLVDRVSHPYWAYERPEDYDSPPTAEARWFASAVRDAYRETDRQLGEVLSVAGPDTYVLIVSDHGFRSSPDRSKAIGTHDFNGIYLVAGPGLTSASGRRGLIEDIGPTALYLLRLPVGRDMSGTVIPEVATQLGRPVDFIDSYEDGPRTGHDDPVDDETMKQLEGLGYLD